MGFRFRKSINLGPIRINFGKSGVGYSVGCKGMRTGVKANGKTYTTHSIPGTGMSYTTEGKRDRSSGCLLAILVGIVLLSVGAAYTVTRFS